MTKDSKTSTDILEFIRETFSTQEFIPLHAPVFAGDEKKYVNDCLDSTFVSSVDSDISVVPYLVYANFIYMCILILNFVF